MQGRTDGATTLQPWMGQLHDALFQLMLTINKTASSMNTLALIAHFVVDAQLLSYVCTAFLLGPTWLDFTVYLRLEWLTTATPAAHLTSIAVAYAFLVLMIATGAAVGRRNDDQLTSWVATSAIRIQQLIALLLPSCLFIPLTSITWRTLPCTSPLTTFLGCGSGAHAAVAIVALALFIAIYTCAYIYELTFYHIEAVASPSVLGRLSWRFQIEHLNIRALIVAIFILQEPPAPGTRAWSLAISIAVAFHINAYGLITYLPWTNDRFLLVTTVISWTRAFIAQIVILRLIRPSSNWNVAIVTAMPLIIATVISMLAERRDAFQKLPIVQGRTANELLLVMQITMLRLPKAEIKRDKALIKLKQTIVGALEKATVDAALVRCIASIITLAALSDPGWSERILMHARSNAASAGLGVAFLLHRLQSALSAANTAQVVLIRKMKVDRRLQDCRAQIELAIGLQFILWRGLLDKSNQSAGRIDRVCNELSVCMGAAQKQLNELGDVTGGKSAAVVRLKAEFFMSVLSDTHTGTRLMEKADGIEAHQREMHREGDGAAMSNGAPMVMMSNAHLLVSASEGSLGIVREATAEALALLGRDELIGQNMSVILPPLIAKHHDRLVQRFAAGTTGDQIVGIQRELFAIHGKTGALILLNVSLSLAPGVSSEPGAIVIAANMAPLDRSVDFPVVVLDSNSYKVLYANDPASKYFKDGAVIGRALEELVPDALEHMGEMNTLDGALLQALRDTETLDDVVVQMKSLLTAGLIQVRIRPLRGGCLSTQRSMTKPVGTIATKKSTIHKSTVSRHEEASGSNEDDEAPAIAVGRTATFAVDVGYASAPDAASKNGDDDLHRSMHRKLSTSGSDATESSEVQSMSSASSASSTQSNLNRMRQRWFEGTQVDRSLLSLAIVIIISSLLIFMIGVIQSTTMAAMLTSYMANFDRMMGAHDMRQMISRVGYITEATALINSGDRGPIHDTSLQYSALSPLLDHLADRIAAVINIDLPEGSAVKNSYQKDRVRTATTLSLSGGPGSDSLWFDRDLSIADALMNYIAAARNLIAPHLITLNSTSVAYIIANLAPLDAALANIAALNVDDALSVSAAARLNIVIELILVIVITAFVSAMAFPYLVKAARTTNDMFDMFTQIPHAHVIAMMNRFRLALSSSGTEDEGGAPKPESAFINDAASSAAVVAGSDDDDPLSGGRHWIKLIRQWMQLSMMGIAASIFAIALLVIISSRTALTNVIFNEAFQSGARGALIATFIGQAQHAFATNNATSMTQSARTVNVAFDLHHALLFGGVVSWGDLHSLGASSRFLPSTARPLSDIELGGSIKRLASREQLWFSNTHCDLIGAQLRAIDMTSFNCSSDDLHAPGSHIAYLAMRELSAIVLDSTHFHIVNMSSGDMVALSGAAAMVRLAVNTDTGLYDQEMHNAIGEFNVTYWTTKVVFVLLWFTIAIFIVSPSIVRISVKMQRTRFMCVLVPYNILKELPLFREKLAQILS